MVYDIQTVQAVGREFHFVLNSAVDHIQGVIRSGAFYELQELEMIADLVERPQRILDVGANIGNHTLYFAHRFDPILTIPVEPNPLVVPLLRANLGLNWHRSFDLSLVGCGMSDREGRGTCHVANEANLGGARLGRKPINAFPGERFLIHARYEPLRPDRFRMARDRAAAAEQVPRRSAGR